MREGLTWQQKVWVGGRAVLKASGPLAVYFFMPALTMSAGYVILHPAMTAQEFFTYGGNFYTALGMVLTLFVMYRISVRRGRNFFDDVTLYIRGVHAGKAAGFVLFGMAAALAWSAFLTLLPRSGMMRAYTEASSNMLRGRDMLFTAVTTVITAPLAEEMIFRGYMLNTLLETFTERTAVLITSALFAVCHGEVMWMLYAMFMGLLLARVSMREDNILYCIFLHMGFNLPSVLIWMISLSPGASGLFFAGRWLTAGYGLAGVLAALILAARYRKMETVE